MAIVTFEELYSSRSLIGEKRPSYTSKLVLDDEDFSIGCYRIYSFDSFTSDTERTSVRSPIASVTNRGFILHMEDGDVPYIFEEGKSVASIFTEYVIADNLKLRDVYNLLKMEHNVVPEFERKREQLKLCYNKPVLEEALMVFATLTLLLKLPSGIFEPSKGKKQNVDQAKLKECFGALWKEAA